MLPFVNEHERGYISILLFLWFNLCILCNTSSEKTSFSFLPLKINVFVETGFSIVVACGRCWVTIPAIV